MTAKKEILDLNRFDPTAMSGIEGDLAERVAKRHATFGASSVLFYEQPIEMVRAEGAYMYDAEGRRYLDVYNNVPSVGHCHPRVVEAVSKQIGTLNIHTRYLTRIVETYSERLLEHFPDPLSNVIFTCTGSESNDLAMRIARIATGGQGFVVTEAAYHGNTALVTEISPSSLRHRKPADFVRLVPAPSKAIAIDGDIGAGFAASIEKAIAELKAAGHGFAGLIVDSIFSSDGIFAEPAGFLKQAAAVVAREGGLFIADEVQPGFARTGGGMWGFGRHGIVPDVVTMGKPMGNGFPMAGVVTRPDLLSGFCNETGYFNTFGGNPVAAAAGLAVLDVIRDEGLVDHAGKTGASFLALLRELKTDHAAIGDVRGAGLFIGLDFNDPDTGAPDTPRATAVINALKKRGILIGAAGLYGNTLKIRPPLAFTDVDAAFFTENLKAVLEAL